MITVNGIRNALWCAIAFGIVACASAPMPSDKLAVAKTAVERAEQAQAAQFAQVELTTARNKLAAAQAAADKHDARLIVVGTYGESPIRGAILGSTPHKLLHWSGRPVLCVPPPAAE